MRRTNIEYSKGHPLLAQTPGPGRPRQWTEAVHVKLPAGTIDTIARVLKRGESRAAFVREAIAQAVRRRRRKVETDTV